MFGLTIEQIAFIFRGAGWTIVLSLLGFVGGTIFGLPVALARASRRRSLKILSGLFVQLVQGIPLPVIMFVVYFGISIGGYDVPALVAAGIAMTLYSSAYLGEIWRGSIEAVPKGQTEAAKALSLRYVSRMKDVILPQAIRISLPATVGFLVQLIKGTSLAAIVGFTELTRAGNMISNQIFQPLLVFAIVGILYFIMCWPLSLLGAHLERQLAVATR